MRSETNAWKDIENNSDGEATFASPISKKAAACT